MTTHADTERAPIRREIGDDGVAILTLDRPGSTANVLDEATLTALEEELRWIEQSDSLRGVVWISAKPTVFMAGADLEGLYRLLPAPGEEPAEALQAYIERAQGLFQRLAEVPIPTVAAIHGACLGGGLEMALACRYRVASADPMTKIGFPEVQLGILPAWGGCYRLPRVIGLPKALDMILNARTIRARIARRQGLVDEVVPKDRLQRAAVRLIREDREHGPRRRSRLRLALMNNPLTAGIAYWQASRAVQKRARGAYPAVRSALQVTTGGLFFSTPKALARERRAVNRLLATSTCHELIRLYFLRERAKKQSVAEGRGRPVKRTAVIGAGVMGAGIAQWLSSRGYPVVLRDIEPSRVADGMRRIHKLFEEGKRRGLFDAQEVRDGWDRIYPAAGEVPLTGVDVVMEAASENLEIKQAIFTQLGETTPPDTLLATNTSALSIEAIAKGCGNPERVVGLHFFNPVHRMELVEVVAGPATDQASLQTAVGFVQRIGKLPVVVSDSPGFLVNRILVPYLLEAGRLVERGDSIEAIDESMLEFGMPMGPLRLLDEVGLDIGMEVARTLTRAFPRLGDVPELLQKMVDSGWVGRKGGAGFYIRHNSRPRPNPDLVSGRSPRGGRRDGGPLAARLLSPMIHEAARCVEEKVVGDAETVDFSMVMGVGFPPFRGGPLRYADRLGARSLVETAEALVAQGEDHHQPCALLQEMAANGRSFYPDHGGAMEREPSHGLSKVSS